MPSPLRKVERGEGGRRLDEVFFSRFHDRNDPRHPIPRPEQSVTPAAFKWCRNSTLFGPPTTFAIHTRKSSAVPARSAEYFARIGLMYSATNESTCSGARPMYLRASRVLSSRPTRMNHRPSVLQSDRLLRRVASLDPQPPDCDANHFVQFLSVATGLNASHQDSRSP